MPVQVAQAGTPVVLDGDRDGVTAQLSSNVQIRHMAVTEVDQGKDLNIIIDTSYEGGLSV